MVRSVLSWLTSQLPGAIIGAAAGALLTHLIERRNRSAHTALVAPVRKEYIAQLHLELMWAMFHWWQTDRHDACPPGSSVFGQVALNMDQLLGDPPRNVRLRETGPYEPLLRQQQWLAAKMTGLHEMLDDLRAQRAVLGDEVWLAVEDAWMKMRRFRETAFGPETSPEDGVEFSATHLRDAATSLDRLLELVIRAAEREGVRPFPSGPHSL
jgi:hypothetical protein